MSSRGLGSPGRGQSGHNPSSPYFIPPVPVYPNYRLKERLPLVSLISIRSIHLNTAKALHKTSCMYQLARTVILQRHLTTTKWAIILVVVQAHSNLVVRRQPLNLFLILIMQSILPVVHLE